MTPNSKYAQVRERPHHEVVSILHCLVLVVEVQHGLPGAATATAGGQVHRRDYMREDMGGYGLHLGADITGVLGEGGGWREGREGREGKERGERGEGEEGREGGGRGGERGRERGEGEGGGRGEREREERRSRGGEGRGENLFKIERQIKRRKYSLCLMTHTHQVLTNLHLVFLKERKKALMK